MEQLVRVAASDGNGECYGGKGSYPAQFSSVSLDVSAGSTGGGCGGKRNMGNFTGHG